MSSLSCLNRCRVPALAALVLLAPAAAAATPIHTVFAGPGGRESCGGASDVISGSPIAVTADHACTGPRGTASAFASSEPGILRAAAEAKSFHLSIGTADTANALFSDVVTFSRLDPSLPASFSASLNLAVSGLLEAVQGGSNGIMNLLVSLGGIHQMSVANSAQTGGRITNPGGFVISDGVDPTGVSDALLRSPTRTLAIGNQPFTISLSVAATALANGHAQADFANTVQFPTGIDVFNLPAGYTANAGDYLVNNRFRFVDPEPPPPISAPGNGALALVGAALMLAGVRRFSGGAPPPLS